MGVTLVHANASEPYTAVDHYFEVYRGDDLIFGFEVRETRLSATETSWELGDVSWNEDDDVVQKAQEDIGDLVNAAVALIGKESL